MTKRRKIQVGLNLTPETHSDLKFYANQNFDGNLSVASEYLIKKALEVIENEK